MNKSTLTNLNIEIHKDIEYIIKPFLVDIPIAISAIMINKKSRDDLLRHGLTNRGIDHIAGEIAAQKAMKKFSDCKTNIEYRNTNIPIWPTPFVGSITHKGNLVVSAVSLKKSFDSIGIDLEFFQNSDKVLVDRVVTIAEKKLLGSKIQFKKDHYITYLFSMKEAAYKCINHLPKFQNIGFKDIEVTYAEFREGYYACSLSVFSKGPKDIRLEGLIVKLDTYQSIFCIVWKNPINSGR